MHHFNFLPNSEKKDEKILSVQSKQKSLIQNIFSEDVSVMSITKPNYYQIIITILITIVISGVMFILLICQTHNTFILE